MCAGALCLASYVYSSAHLSLVVAAKKMILGPFELKRFIQSVHPSVLPSLSMGPKDSDVELAAATACWLSAAKNMAVKRRCLVFEPGCAALVSSPVSHDVNASKRRLPLANSTGRTTLLGTALMDAGCSALLAAAEAKAGFASGGALFALTPG